MLAGYSEGVTKIGHGETFGELPCSFDDGVENVGQIDEFARYLDHVAASDEGMFEFETQCQLDPSWGAEPGLAECRQRRLPDLLILSSEVRSESNPSDLGTCLLQLGRPAKQ